MNENNLIRMRNQDFELEQDYGPEQDYGYYEGYGSAPAENEKQQLFKIFAIIKKHWFLVLAINIIATGLVIVYEAQKPDYYKSEIRIQVNGEMNPAMGAKTGGSVIFNQGVDQAYFTTQLQIIEGSGLLRRVVKGLDLEHNDSFFPPKKGQNVNIWQNVLRMFGLSKPTQPVVLTKGEKTEVNLLDVSRESASDLDRQAETLAPYVGLIGSGLTVMPVKDMRTASRETRLIEVEFTHHDPQVAAKVVNAIGDVYVLQNLETKVESNAAAGDFLQKRVAELQSQIRAGEERLINYAKDNQIISLDSGQNTVVQRLGDLNAKLGAAEMDRIAAEAAYRSAMQNPMMGTTAENRDARTSGLESQLSTLKQQLAQLKTEYTDEWPAVIQLRKQIDVIEQELQKNKKRSTDTQIATLQQTFREAAARESELRGNFEAQRGSVLKQNEAAVNYRIIQQEIDTNKSLLDNLLQRSREIDVLLNGTPNNVSVTDRALVPRSPDGPTRTKNVMLAFLVSLIFGVGLAFALNFLDDTIRVSDNLEFQLGSPVVGIIPGTYPGITKRLLSTKFRKNGKTSNGKISYYLDGFQRPIVQEAFHQLRTSILLSTAGGAPHTILVTSGQPLEGKTITSLNLAKSLSQLGKKVLLIDADLRSPKMHFICNLSNNVGMGNLITANAIDDDIVQDTIHHDFEPDLDIITAGPTVPNAANLFSSEEMRALLKRFSTMYTHIVIDSPPVLYFADSIILATQVDAVLLIARANKSSRDVLSRAKKRLQDVRANVIGIVLNDVPLGEFKYYNNAYYLGNGKDEPNESLTELNLG